MNSLISSVNKINFFRLEMGRGGRRGENMLESLKTKLRTVKAKPKFLQKLIEE